MDVIDFAAMSDTDDLPVASPATGQSKSGSTSFKNDLTKCYGSKYRDPDNSDLLMGELMPIGNSFGILAICMFVPNLPTEKHACGSIAGLEECCQARLEHEQHQGPFRVA